MKPHTRVEFRPPAQKLQLDHRCCAYEVCAEAGGESGRGDERSARGQDVVDDQDAVVRVQSVVMDFQRVFAIFEDIFVATGGPGKLAGLANGDESSTEHLRDDAAEDESPRLDPRDLRDR